MKNRKYLILTTSVWMFLFLLRPAASLSAEDITFYVSPAGNDANPGTENQPVGSFNKAKDLVRNARKTQPDSKVTVYFADGVYSVEEPVRLTSEDSGTPSAPVTYRAADGAKPVFSGSKAITQWSKLYDMAILSKLDPSAMGKVYVTNLHEAGVTNLGDPTDVGLRPELFCNRQLQTLARWPNEGFVEAGKAKGSTDLELDYRNIHKTAEGVFEYLDPRQDKWAYEQDVRLSGYWCWDWLDEYQRVQFWDDATRTVHTTPPYHIYGYRDNLRYYGLNLLCEIDSPGEWYLDRRTGLLYWYPPAGVDPLLQDTEIHLTHFSGSYMLEMTNCSHVTVEGLTFREGRGSAISISGGSRNLILGCRIERFGNSGILIYQGSGHGVKGCLLSMLGCGGIRVYGGNRKTLESSGHYVEHNVIEYFATFKRTYEPAVLFTGCGVRIAHNRFQFSPWSAMRLDGNDVLVEYNQIYRVVEESDDQGGIDMWYNPSYRGNIFRYNYWSNITGGLRHGSAAIRLDDMICGTTIFGNLFERCGILDFGAIQIHGGKDNVVDNNIFYKCRAMVSFTHWDDARWLQELNSAGMHKMLYEDVDITSDVYLEKYPELTQSPLSANINKNTIRNNFYFDTTNDFVGRNRPQIESNNVPQNNIAKDANFCLEQKMSWFKLQPIPLNEIGPKENRWLTGFDPSATLPFDPVSASEFLKLRLTCSGQRVLYPSEDVSVSIYPNPATDRLYIQSVKPVKHVDLIDITGKTVLSKSGLSLQDISLDRVSSGVYIVRITTETNDKAYIKLRVKN